MSPNQAEQGTQTMPTFTKGNFSINLGIVSFGGEIDEADRQCAWELYCELVSRVAVVGKLDSNGNHTFEGEVLAESLDSLYHFFTEARHIMRAYPLGRLTAGKRDASHLGFFIAGMLEGVLRPFLEKWQASYRYWWDHQSDRQLSPFRRQAGFESLDDFLADWSRLRDFCRATAGEIEQHFELPSVLRLMPPELERLWQQETKKVIEGV